MILSRANLVIAQVAPKDDERPALCSLHIAPDGSTVASDGNMVLCCSPLKQDRAQFPDSVEHVKPLSIGANVRLDAVSQILKNMGTRLATAFVALTRCDIERIALTTADRRGEQTTACAPIPQRFPEWRTVFRKAWRALFRADIQADRRVCVSRKRLIELLSAIDSACYDKSEGSPIYIEFGTGKDAIVLQAQNYSTDQRIVGVLSPLDVGDCWIKETVFSRSLSMEVHKKTAKRKRINAL